MPSLQAENMIFQMPSYSCSMRHWHTAQNQLQHKKSKPNKMALPVINSVPKTNLSHCGKQLHSTAKDKVGLFHHPPTCHRNIFSKTTWKAPTQSYWTASKILSFPLSLIWRAVEPKHHTTHTVPPGSGLDSPQANP